MKSTIITRLVKFIQEEPSGRFSAVENNTDGIIWRRAFRGIDIERLSEFSNRFDETQVLTLLYLSQICKCLVENTMCPVTDALADAPQLAAYRECLSLVASKEVSECHKALVEKMALVVSAISSSRLLGDDMDALSTMPSSRWSRPSTSSDSRHTSTRASR